MPQVPRLVGHLRRCIFCADYAIDDDSDNSDERHCVFDCPDFQGLMRHAGIFQDIDSNDAMRSLMWHTDQLGLLKILFVLLCWPLSKARTT